MVAPAAIARRPAVMSAVCAVLAVLLLAAGGLFLYLRVELLSPEALLEAVADGFRALSDGAVTAPRRQAVETERGAVLTMAGRRAGGPVVVKLVGIFPGNAAHGEEAHQAVICLLDAETGAVRRRLAGIDGEELVDVRFSDDGQLLASVTWDSHVAIVWDVGSGAQRTEFPTSEGGESTPPPDGPDDDMLLIDFH